MLTENIELGMLGEQSTARNGKCVDRFNKLINEQVRFLFKSHHRISWIRVYMTGFKTIVTNY